MKRKELARTPVGHYIVSTVGIPSISGTEWNTALLNEHGQYLEEAAASFDRATAKRNHARVVEALRGGRKFRRRLGYTRHT